MTRDLVDVRSLPLLPLLERTFDGVVVVLPMPWRLAYVNPTLAEWAGFRPTELVGRQVYDLFRVSGDLSFDGMLDNVLSRQTQEETVSAQLVISGQKRLPVDVRIIRLLDDEPILGVVVRKAGDSQHHGALAPAERRDPLTTLPDRAFLVARLDALIRHGRADDRRFAVLFVDLDNFKQVNDAHGHLVGDGVLREVARRLNACVREGDCVVRYGGDEFVVIVDRVEGLEEVQLVIRRLHAALCEPIPLPIGEANLSASIGAAIWSRNVRTAEEILTAADRDMYASKQARSS